MTFDTNVLCTKHSSLYMRIGLKLVDHGAHIGEDDNDDEDDNDNEDDLVFQMDQELDRSQQTVTITTGPLII